MKSQKLFAETLATSKNKPGFSFKLDQRLCIKRRATIITPYLEKTFRTFNSVIAQNFTFRFDLILRLRVLRNILCGLHFAVQGIFETVFNLPFFLLAFRQYPCYK